MMDTTQQQQDRFEAAEERQIAMSILIETFAEAELDGLDEDSMTQAALFVAFQKLVSCYGEDAVATFAERLPERVRHGEFSILTRQ
jgi:hypothetical protein